MVKRLQNITSAAHGHWRGGQVTKMCVYISCGFYRTSACTACRAR